MFLTNFSANTGLNLDPVVTRVWFMLTWQALQASAKPPLGSGRLQFSPRLAVCPGSETVLDAQAVRLSLISFLNSTTNSESAISSRIL